MKRPIRLADRLSVEIRYGVAVDGTKPRLGPLRDLVVLDLSRVLAGPYAAMLLGDMGARVIKVERPGGGDDTRAWGPPFVGSGDILESTYFLSVNRNKESITLDFKDETDFRVLTRLIERADVLIENFRPGVMARLGLDAEKLHELNPKLVIASISGFGKDGPDVGRSGYDQILQGEAGIMSMTGPDENQPVKVGIPVGDLFAGLFAVLGALSAIHDRTLTGKGSTVSTSLLSALVSTHAFQGTRWLVAGDLPKPSGNHHPTLAPYGVFQCEDGPIQVAIGNDSQWRAFAPLVDIDPVDERFTTNGARAANRQELELLITEALSRASIEYWAAKLAAQGIPFGRIKSLDQVYADPQVQSQGLVMRMKHPTLGDISIPGSALRMSNFDGPHETPNQPPPVLGEHSEQIREWLARPLHESGDPV